MFKSIKALLLGSLVLGSMVNAATFSQTVTAQDEEALEVQFVPTNNDGTMEARALPLAEYLSEALGREVNVTLATDYTTIVQAMASGQVDLGIMPPAAYVQARDLGSAKAILTSVLGKFDDETGLPLEDETTGSFQGEILVKADSDMQELTDLVGKKIATLSPNSASGYIYPVAEMINAGMDITKDVTLTTVNDIPSEITAVLNGQQDAAFVFEGARVVFSGAFPDNDLMEELRVLYLTEGEIPNDAIAVQPDMDDALQEAIKEAFLAMADTEEGVEIMSLWSHLGYTEVDEAIYDQIKEYTEIAAQ